MRKVQLNRIVSVTLLAFLMLLISCSYMTSDVFAVSKPSKVTSVKAVSNSYNSVTVSWRKAKNAKKYEVYRSTATKGKYIKVVTLSSKKTKYFDKKVLAGKTYYYKVRAVNGKKKGIFSSLSKAKPVLNAPLVEVENDNGVKISWKKVEGATSYIIERKGSTDKSFKTIKNLSSAALKYSDSTVENDNTYTYSVTAIRNYKKTQYYNSKTRKWQDKKPTKKYWKGKKTRKITYYTARCTSEEKQIIILSGNDSISYKEDVIASELENETEYSVITNTSERVVISVKESTSTKELKVGDIALFPGNEMGDNNGIAIKIVSIKKNGDALTFYGTPPELQEVIEDFEINELDSIECAIFEPSEYVEIPSKVERNILTESSNANGENNSNESVRYSFDPEVGISCKVKLKDFDFEDDLGSSIKVNGELSANVNMTIAPTMELHYDQGIIPNGFFQTKITKSAALTTLGGIKGRIRLGYCTLIYTPVFHVSGNVFLCVGADGQMSVEIDTAMVSRVTIGGRHGIDYSKKLLYIDTQRTGSINISGTVYVDLAAKIAQLNVICGYVDAGIGCTAKETLWPTQPIACTDFSVYPKLEMGLDEHEGVIKIIDRCYDEIDQWSIVLLDSDNAFIKEHYENGDRTENDQCSHDKKVSLIGAKEYNGHHYKVYHEKITWDEAKEDCRLRGGHLVTITSEEEQLFIESIYSGEGELWLGASKLKDEPNSRLNWEWVTGEKWEYNNFAPSQPDNQISFSGKPETVLTIWGTKKTDSKIPYRWNDLDPEYSSYIGGYICEWDD